MFSRLDEATVEAVEEARGGNGPGFLIMETYRYLGHGMSDVDRPYRTRDEEREWRQTRDPIDRLRHPERSGGSVTMP